MSFRTIPTVSRATAQPGDFEGCCGFAVACCAGAVGRLDCGIAPVVIVTMHSSLKTVSMLYRLFPALRGQSVGLEPLQFCHNLSRFAD